MFTVVGFDKGYLTEDAFKKIKVNHTIEDVLREYGNLRVELLETKLL